MKNNSYDLAVLIFPHQPQRKHNPPPALRGLAVLLLLTGLAFTMPAQEQVLDFAPPGAASEAHGKHIQLVKKANDRADFESAAGVCVARKAQREDYFVLELPNGSVGGEVGEPQLPYYGQFVEVPEGANVRLVIDQVDWVDLKGEFMVLPRQPPPWDVKDAPPRAFEKKAQVYARDQFLPAEPVRVADSARIRGRELVYVMYTPVMFNPAQKKLKAARQVKWHLEYQLPANQKPKKKQANAIADTAFAPLLANTVDATMAPEAVDAPNAPDLATGAGADYLVITHDDFYDAVLPLANWKHAKGYRTRVVRTSAIASGGTAAGITTYIKNAYDTWSPSPTYVLLVGDSAYIPPHYKTIHSYDYALIATDLYYAAVDGTDLFPDLFLGRLPCTTATQCSNMVAKILTVEKTPNTISSFYSTAMTAGYFQDLTTTDPTDAYEGRVFMETVEAVRAYLAWLGYTVNTSYVTETATTPRHYNRDTDAWGSLVHTNGATYVNPPTYVSSTSATAALTNGVNSGVWILQHRDHGSSSGWSHPSFTTTHVNALNNSNRLPVVMSINCLTAQFDGGSDSFCEAWIKKPVGGSHAVIGATRVSSSWYNDWMVHGFFECMYANYLETLATFTGYRSTLSYGNNYVGKGTHMGQILDYGKIVMYDKISGGSQTGTTREQFEIMEYFGDPEHSPRNAYPYNMTVTHPSRITATVPTNFTVTVTTSGTPVEGALVALVLDPGDFHTDLTDAAGVAHFNFTPQTPLSGSNQMSVTVSHQNRRPYLGTLSVDTLGMTVSVPSSAREGDGVLTGQGRVTIPAVRAANLTVNLSSTDTTEVTVPASVTIVAGSTNATFNVTVVDDALLDGTKSAQIRATATGYGDALDNISILDNETATLTLELPSPVYEDTGAMPAVLRSSRAPVENFTITLNSSDTSEVQVPVTVLLLAGSTQAVFTAHSIEDSYIDGPRTAVVTASVTGWTSGVASVTVLDNESTNITLTLPTMAMEGNGTLVNAGVVTLGGLLTSNLVVALSSSDTTELTVPASVTVSSGNLSATFSPAVVNDVLVDGPQKVRVTATPPGLGRDTAQIIIYDNESPPPAINPTPADGESNVVVTTGLTWQYLGGAGAGVISNDVYFGTNPSPGAGEFVGTTTNNIWVLPRLAPNTRYYWKIVTRRNVSTTSAVWDFTTRGLHHFAWAHIPSPQVALNPFPVTVAARDEFNTVVSNFTGTVELSGLVGTPSQQQFYDGFEDGNFSGWTIESGTYARFVTNNTSGGGGYSLSLLGGNIDHFDGVSHSLANIQPEVVNFYVRASASNVYSAYVVLGQGETMGETAVFFRADEDGQMGLYEDTGGVHAAPYEANRWYKVSLRFDWGQRRVDYYRDDALIEAGIRFRSTNVTALSIISLYNYNNVQAWWDEIECLSSNQVQRIRIAPTNSGSFVQGVWSGDMTVFAPVTNMLLQAEDSAGHTGSSGRFNVVTNDQPVLSVRDTTVLEGNSGTRQAAFSLSLWPPADTEVTIRFSTGNGTATQGSDYLGTNGVLTFPAGTTAGTLQVLIYGDTTPENHETFFLELSDPTGAVLSNAVATCTIWDDDGPPNLYLSSINGEPWNSSANINALNRVFGANWQHAFYETVDPALAFSGVYEFIFMEGGDDAANELETFRANNSSAIYNWVYAGGRLLLNAAPTEGDGMYCGFSVSLYYPEYCDSANSAWPAHPVFNGPFTPVGTAWTGNRFGHASLAGGGITALITNSADGGIVLGEKTYGNGFVVFGGLTTDNWHDPDPQSSNLTANIIAWAADPKPYVTIGDIVVVEGDAGTTNAVFTISLNRPYGTNVSIRFGTGGVTATPNVDYYVTNSFVVIPPGVTSVQIPVRIIGDDIQEGHEGVNLVLLGATNAILLDTVGLCTIVDDDLPPTVFIHSSAGFPWNSGAYTNAMNTVFGQTNWQLLTYESVDPVTLFTPATRFIYMEGSAGNADELESFLSANRSALYDWLYDGGYLLLNAGPTEGDGMYVGLGISIAYPYNSSTATVASVSHPIVTGPYTPVGTTWNGNRFGHAVLEGTDLIPLLLSTNDSIILGEKAYGAGNVVCGGMTAINWHDPDPQASNLFCNIIHWAANPKPYVSINDISIVEGDTGTTNAIFTVSLNRPHPSSVRVTYNTSGNTAVAGQDYNATAGTLIFTQAVTSLQIPVPIRGDTLREGFEDFRMLLLTVTNAVLQDSSGLCTIMDNDVAPYVYLHSTVGDPWSSSAYTNTMSRVFGTNWQLAFYETVDVAQLFSPVTRFIYMEGSAGNAIELETFLSDHYSAIYSWVYNGGRLYLNAAPTEGDGMSFLFGANLVYSSPSSYTRTAAVTSVYHPIVNGPFTPTGTSWIGDAFAHGKVSGSFQRSLIVNTTNGHSVLAESTYGNGNVVFGGMTACNYHDPDPHASNLFANILAWAADPKPYLSITDATALEGDAGTVNLVFDVSLSRSVSFPVTVNFATANWTASSSSDYYATNGMLTFAPGVTYQQLIVRVRGDTLGESDEAFRLLLSNPTNAVLQDNEGLGTIQNDDLFLATLPFTETWETAGFRPFWTVSGEGPSRALVTTNEGAHGGSYHLLLDSATNGVYARNEVTLAMDLAGFTNVTLRFWAREFSDDSHGPPPIPFQFGENFDGVAVSMDGLWWFEAQGLRALAATNREFVVNLDAVLGSYGLAYTTPFYIRFNQYDNYNVISGDGIAIDDISVSGSLQRVILHPASSLLAAEGCLPANGAADPGERVTLSLALRNDGTAPPTNLMATLQSNPGVLMPSGPESYGAIPAGGTVSRNFSFTAEGVCGDVIYATLQLQDGPVNLGLATFPIRLGTVVPRGTSTFTNPASITIPDGVAALYPSTITVSNFSYPITRVTVQLRGLTHTWPDDIDILLVSPVGQSALLMSDVGGNTDVTNLTLTLDDGYLSPLPDQDPLTSGYYRPFNYGSIDTFPAPAPAAPYGVDLAAFNGTNPNGTWQLFVNDDAGGDVGVLTNGWLLSIQTGETVCCMPQVTMSYSIQTNHLIASWQSVPGQTYLVQYADELSPPVEWYDLTTMTGDGNLMNFVYPTTNAPQRFFRLTLP